MQMLSNYVERGTKCVRVREKTPGGLGISPSFLLPIVSLGPEQNACRMPQFLLRLFTSKKTQSRIIEIEAAASARRLQLKGDFTCCLPWLHAFESKTDRERARIAADADDCWKTNMRYHLLPFLPV